MQEYTLVYIKKDDYILMLNRNKKRNDFNQGKWIGVGGKIEANEDKIACMYREVLEETNLKVLKYKYLGKINFQYDDVKEIIHLFVVNQFQGEINYNCNEGELKFIKTKDIKQLNLWESDYYFLDFIFQEKSFKKIEIIYKYQVLEEVKVNGVIKFNFHFKMMELAIAQAKKAILKNEVPIGAVIVYQNKVILKTYNQKEKTKNSLKHAEHILIDKLLSKTKNTYLDNYVLYTTLEPCLLCTGAIIQSRIKKVYYGARDNKGGFLVSNLKVKKNKGIHHKIEIIHLKKYEGLISQMLKDFFKKIRL